MAQAEFIVGPTTTAILEAAILDRPYLCLHLDDFPLWPPLDTEEVPVAHDYESLANLIRDYRDIWPRARRAILKDGCGLDPDAPWENPGFERKVFQDIAAWIDSLQYQA